MQRKARPSKHIVTLLFPVLFTVDKYNADIAVDHDMTMSVSCPSNCEKPASHAVTAY